MDATLQSNRDTLSRLSPEERQRLWFEGIRRPESFPVREEYLRQEFMVNGLVRGEKTAMQKVHTPFALAEGMINKLKESIGPYPSGLKILVYNVEFLDILYRMGIMWNNEIWFVNENPLKVQWAKDIYRGDGDDQFIVQNWLDWNTDMKFDVICGNPPYQLPPEEGKGKKSGARGRLWDKFVLKSLSLLKDKGYLALIHPGSWRKPGHELWSVISSKQVEYLEMHPQHSNCGSAATGLKTFGVNTSYDVYILHNVPCHRTTTVVDFNEKVNKIDLRDWSWLPGGEFELIKSMLIGKGEDGWEITCNYSYGTTPTYMGSVMSAEKSSKYKYPAISSITQDGPTFYWSCRNDRGHYGIIKVILSKNGHPNALADLNGEYATTQNSFFVTVKSKEQAKNLVKLLGTDEFKRVIWATKWSNFDVEEGMFRYFKKSLYHS